MDFAKLQGTGNDFIIINNMRERIPPELLGAAARQLCQRRRSVGADGLMAVDAPEAGGDYKMRFYNSDGSLGEMCGNGARCVARYSYENGLAGEKQRIETSAGMVTAERIDRRMYRVRLNDPSVIRLNESVEIKGKTYNYSYLELGSPGIPHVALELPEFWLMEERELRELGRSLRLHPRFPKGANVNFFAITEENRLTERTYERGVEDFTLACGTGTGCVVTALTLAGRVSGSAVEVNVPGGQLFVDVEQTGLYLTGLTNVVAEGRITDEEFRME